VQRHADLPELISRDARHVYPPQKSTVSRTLGRHQGNFPRAITCLGLINAVLHVIEVERGHHSQKYGPLI
jgi:hypothetical protein